MKIRIDDNCNDNYGKWFWKKYWKLVFIGIIIYILCLILIYMLFAYSNIISAGINLHRSDWLYFIGGILALTGSLIVSAISITQASYFNEREQERQKIQRIESRIFEIKPELVIVINRKNIRIPYIDRWPSEKLHIAMFGEPLPERYKEKNRGDGNDIIQAINTDKMTKNYPINNVWVSVVNTGKYSINHVEIYGEYYFPFIKPGESIDIILTLDKYPRSTEFYRTSDGIEKINESNSKVKIIDVRKEKVDECGAHIDNPKQYDCIWIEYEDVDGNKYRQTFRTHPSGVGSYYCNDELKFTVVD